MKRDLLENKQHKKRNILIMDTGSYKTFGGSVKDSYDLYLYISKNKNYNVDMLGNFSKMDNTLKSLQISDVFSEKYANAATSSSFDYKLVLTRLFKNNCLINKKFLDRKYDILLLNSRKDIPIVDAYLERHPNAKTVYIDRGNIVLNYKKSGLRRLSPNMLGSAFLVGLMAKWLNLFIAINAEQYASANSIFKNNTHIIYTGIAPHRIYKKIDIKKTYSGAVYVGRLEEKQKRVSFLIEGIKRVIDNHSELKNRVILKIVGDGPDKNRYIEMVKALGLQKNIIFTGLLFNNDLVNAYNNANFLVSTSIWEGLSRTLLESMACGLPVLINEKINSIIGYNPISNVVSDGYNGLLYRYGDINDFAEKFYMLYNNTALQKKLSKNAIEFLKNKFNIDIIQKRILNEIDCLK